MRTGIYGGTFSPPHNGHVSAAKAFFEQARLDRLLIMPSLISPHKPTAEDDVPQRRVDMLKLAFEGDPRITVCDYEIKQGGVSYTYLTLEHFHSEDDTLCFLTGSDMFLTLDEWKNPGRIFELAEIWCMSRTGDDEAELLRKRKFFEREFGARCFLCRGDAVVVSSSEVRAALRRGEDVSRLVPGAVLAYIEENDLYGAKNAELKEYIKENLSLKRYEHSMGVARTAERIGLELSLPESSLWRLVRAGILHDCTKEMSTESQLSLLGDREVDPDYLLCPQTLHQLSGAVFAEKEFGCDARVCRMIECHCTGAPGMDLCEKIVFLADFTEPGREYEACKRLRNELFSQKLTPEHVDRVFLDCCERQLEHMKEKGSAIHRLTRLTYEKESAKMAENEKITDLTDASSMQIAEKIKQVLDEKLAKNIEIIPVADKTVVTDCFVICNATSTTHVKALADEVETALSLCGVDPYHKDGIAGGEWYVLDYGVVIVHIFVKSAREFYKLDRLWKDKTTVSDNGEEEK